MARPSKGSRAAPGRRALGAGSPLAGGPAARRRLGKLLGVDALRGRGTSVAAASWAPEQVLVQVSGREGPPVLFSIGPAAEAQAPFLRCGALDLRYRGRSLPEALEAAVRAVAPVGLGRATMETLGEIFDRDPRTGRPGEPLPETPELEERRFAEAALPSTWGSPAVWSQFFAVAEVARAQLDSLDYLGECLFVQHSDLECVFIAPQTGVPMVPLVLYPWDDRVRSIDWRRPGARRPPGPETALLTTDLDERDVVLGRGPEALRAALEAACARAGGRTVFCSTTCVPVVSGEDVESVVARARGRASGPLLSLTTTPQSMQGLLAELLVDLRLEAQMSAPSPEPGAVNLVGFPADPATDELSSLLGSLGVGVNARVLPAISPEVVRRLPAAALDVQCPNALWQPHYDQLRLGARGEAIQPPAPYGVDATVAWLERVAEAAGVAGGDRAAVEARAAEARAALAELRDEAASHVLGVVVRAEDAHRLVDPAATWGVAVPALLAELGFGVELLLAAGAKGDLAEGAASELAAVLPAGGRLARCIGPVELGRHLESAGLSAVLSEQLFDRRLAEAGLAGFSLQQLEPGLAGAVRTARRLLELCRLPFFRRYGRHLARAAASRGLPRALG